MSFCAASMMFSQMCRRAPSTPSSASSAGRGATERYQGEISGGPVRKYYRLTEAGQDRYAALLTVWRDMRDALSVLGIQ